MLILKAFFWRSDGYDWNGAIRANCGKASLVTRSLVVLTQVAETKKNQFAWIGSLNRLLEAKVKALFKYHSSNAVWGSYLSRFKWLYVPCTNRRDFPICWTLFLSWKIMQWRRRCPSKLRVGGKGSSEGSGAPFCWTRREIHSKRDCCVSNWNSVWSIMRTIPPRIKERRKNSWKNARTLKGRQLLLTLRAIRIDKSSNLVRLSRNRALQSEVWVGKKTSHGTWNREQSRRPRRKMKFVPSTTNWNWRRSSLAPINYSSEPTFTHDRQRVMVW